MYVEYTLVLCQGKNCRQFSMLTWNSFTGQFVHPGGGDLGIVILACCAFHLLENIKIC